VQTKMIDPLVQTKPYPAAKLTRCLNCVIGLKRKKFISNRSEKRPLDYDAH